MIRKLILIAVLLASTSIQGSSRLYDLDRAGTVYLSPKYGFSYPVGALADIDYNNTAASWRKEGLTLTGEIGYYLTNSTIFGIEASYSNFHPKRLTAFTDPDIYDKSRIRIRRIGIFMQYEMIPTGVLRPFMKLGFGFFEINRISFPTPKTDPLLYDDYSLGAKPVFSGGIGFSYNITYFLSVSLSVEAVSMNSYSSSWQATGQTIGPLNKNQLFFPLYFSIAYHLGNGR